MYGNYRRLPMHARIPSVRAIIGKDCAKQVPFERGRETDHLCSSDDAADGSEIFTLRRARK